MLEATYKAGDSHKRGTIRDLSATGAYLVAQERLNLGTPVQVMLRRKRHSGVAPNRMIYLRAEVVRWGRNGVGLTFVPSHMDDQEWMHLVMGKGEHRGISDLLGRLRVARALAFMLQICPPAMMELSRMLRVRLSNERASRVAHMTHLAEEILHSRRGSFRMRAHPKVVLRILGECSRVDEDLTLQFWAGFLVAACSEGGVPEEDLGFVDLFARLTSIHVRLLVGACHKSGSRNRPPRPRATREFACSPTEVRKIAGIHDLYRIERELNHLFDLGLMERVFTPSPFAPMEGVNLHLTALGRRLCARFWGHRLPFMYRPEDQHTVAGIESPWMSEPLQLATVQ